MQNLEKECLNESTNSAIWEKLTKPPFACGTVPKTQGKEGGGELLGTTKEHLFSLALNRVTSKSSPLTVMWPAGLPAPTIPWQIGERLETSLLISSRKKTFTVFQLVCISFLCQRCSAWEKQARRWLPIRQIASKLCKVLPRLSPDSGGRVFPA